MSLIVFMPGFRSSATFILPFFENSQWWLDPDHSPLATLCPCAFKIQLFCLFFILVSFHFLFLKGLLLMQFPVILLARSPLSWIGSAGPVSGLGPRLHQPESPCDINGFLYQRLLPASFSSRATGPWFSVESNRAGRLCLGVGTRDTTQQWTRKEGDLGGETGKVPPSHPHHHHHNLTRQSGRGWRC